MSQEALFDLFLWHDRFITNPYSEQIFQRARYECALKIANDSSFWSKARNMTVKVYMQGGYHYRSLIDQSRMIDEDHDDIFEGFVPDQEFLDLVASIRLMSV